MVVPDPARLDQAASVTLSEEFTAQGLADPFADPLVTDPALTSALRESPVEPAVDVANQTRYLQEDSGPCAGCVRPANPDYNPVEPAEDHPIEP